MPCTIVVALDGSEGADRALPIAAEEARRHGAKLIVAHAETHAREVELLAGIRRQVDELVRAGLDAELAVEPSMVGDEGQTIVEIARAHDADLIAIATRGRGPFVDLVLGSVTRAVVQRASCPVLVIPPVRTVAADAHTTVDVETAAREPIAPV